MLLRTKRKREDNFLEEERLAKKPRPSSSQEHDYDTEEEIDAPLELAKPINAPTYSLPCIEESIIQQYSLPQTFTAAVALMKRMTTLVYQQNQILYGKTNEGVETSIKIVTKQDFTCHVTDVKCSCRASAHQVLWCEHVCAALLKLKRFPERVVNQLQFKYLLEMAPRETLLQTVANLCVADPSAIHKFHVSLTDAQEAEKSPKPKTMRKVSMTEVHEAFLPITQDCPTQYVNVNVFSECMHEAWENFERGRIEVRACDRTICECQCHEFDEETCDDCEESRYEFLDMTPLVEQFKQFMEIAKKLVFISNDSYQGMSILETIGNSILAFPLGDLAIPDTREYDLRFRDITPETEGSIAEKYKKMLDALGHLVILILLQPDTVIPTETRQKWTNILCKWHEAQPCFMAAIKVAENPWSSEGLQQVLSGDDIQIMEEEAIMQVRLENLVDAGSLEKAFFYARAVQKHIYASILLLTLDRYGDSIDYALSKLDQYPVAACFMMAYLLKVNKCDNDVLLEFGRFMADRLNPTAVMQTIYKFLLEREIELAFNASQAPILYKLYEFCVKALKLPWRSIFTLVSVEDERDTSANEEFESKYYLIECLVKFAPILHKIDELKYLTCENVPDYQSRIKLANIFEEQLQRHDIKNAIMVQCIIDSKKRDKVVSIPSCATDLLRTLDTKAKAQEFTNLILLEQGKAYSHDSFPVIQNVITHMKNHQCHEEAEKLSIFLFQLVLDNCISKLCDFEENLLKFCIEYAALEAKNERVIDIMLNYLFKSLPIPIMHVFDKNMTSIECTYTDIDAAKQQYLRRSNSKNPIVIYAMASILYQCNFKHCAISVGQYLLDYLTFLPFPSVTDQEVDSVTVIQLGCSCTVCVKVNNFINDPNENELKFERVPEHLHFTTLLLGLDKYVQYGVKYIHADEPSITLVKTDLLKHTMSVRLFKTIQLWSRQVMNWMNHHLPANLRLPWLRSLKSRLTNPFIVMELVQFFEASYLRQDILDVAIAQPFPPAVLGSQYYSIFYQYACECNDLAHAVQFLSTSFKFKPTIALFTNLHNIDTVESKTEQKALLQWYQSVNYESLQLSVSQYISGINDLPRYMIEYLELQVIFGGIADAFSFVFNLCQNIDRVAMFLLKELFHLLSKYNIGPKTIEQSCSKELYQFLRRNLQSNSFGTVSEAKVLVEKFIAPLCPEVALQAYKSFMEEVKHNDHKCIPDMLGQLHEYFCFTGRTQQEWNEFIEARAKVWKSKKSLLNTLHESPLLRTQIIHKNMPGCFVPTTIMPIVPVTHTFELPPINVLHQQQVQQLQPVPPQQQQVQQQQAGPIEVIEID